MTPHYLTAYAFGTGKFPLYEFDVPMLAGQAFRKADFDAKLAEAGIGHYAYAMLQTQLADAEQEFVAKMSLAPGYPLATAPGQALTRLSQAVLPRIELDHLHLRALADGVNVHFVVYG